MAEFVVDDGLLFSPGFNNVDGVSPFNLVGSAGTSIANGTGVIAVGGDGEMSMTNASGGNLTVAGDGSIVLATSETTDLLMTADNDMFLVSNVGKIDITQGESGNSIVISTDIAVTGSAINIDAGGSKGGDVVNITNGGSISFSATYGGALVNLSSINGVAYSGGGSGGVVDVNGCEGSVTLTQGDNIGITADTVAGTITISATGAVEDVNGCVGGVVLTAGTNITITPDTEAGTITIDATAGGGAVDDVNGCVGSVVLTAGSNITVTPNTEAGTITIDAVGGVEDVNGCVGGVVVTAGTNITVTPDTEAGTITIDATVPTPVEINQGGGSVAIDVSGGIAITAEATQDTAITGANITLNGDPYNACMFSGTATLGAMEASSEWWIQLPATPVITANAPCSVTLQSPDGATDNWIVYANPVAATETVDGEQYIHLVMAAAVANDCVVSWVVNSLSSTPSTATATDPVTPP